MNPGQTSLTIPSLSGSWVRGSVRDRAPLVLAILAAASIGSLVFAAATSAPVASRIEVAQHLVIEAIISSTARMGLQLGTVNVSGRVFTTPRDIFNALEVPVGAPLLTLDPEQARQRLEALPWVKHAVVERVLPYGVRIDLIERTPIALWQTRGGDFHLVDADGVVIDDHVGQFSTLPVVVGAGAPEAASDLLAMLNAQPELAPRITAAVRFGQRRWDLWFDGYGVQDDSNSETPVPTGIQVRLPEQGAELALARLAQLDREQGILQRDVAVIDLRQQDRLVIRRTFAPDTPANPNGPRTKPWPGLPLTGPAQDA
jgi:cell division protein FtsQ